ncbi:MAG TPA: hypothetical protein VLS45_03645, partial [Methylomicrobium sp.]|nr:hypothetical protein [Methylomicrobium sp.]
MSDAEADSEAEGEQQQGGSPLLRKVGDGSRAGRRRLGPSDPMATRDDDEDCDDMVESGGRGSDAGRGDDERAPRDDDPCLPPVQQSQQRSGRTIRSSVSRPGVQLQLDGGSSRGSGMLRLCRPHERSDDEGKNSTNGAQRGASADYLHHTSKTSGVYEMSRSSAQFLPVTSRQEPVALAQDSSSLSSEMAGDVRRLGSVVGAYADGRGGFVCLDSGGALRRQLPVRPEQQTVFAEVHRSHSGVERMQEDSDEYRLNALGDSYRQAEQSENLRDHRRDENQLMPEAIGRGSGIIRNDARTRRNTSQVGNDWSSVAEQPRLRSEHRVSFSSPTPDGRLPARSVMVSRSLRTGRGQQLRNTEVRGETRGDPRWRGTEQMAHQLRRDREDVRDFDQTYGAEGPSPHARDNDRPGAMSRDWDDDRRQHDGRNYQTQPPEAVAETSRGGNNDDYESASSRSSSEGRSAHGSRRRKRHH